MIEQPVEVEMRIGAPPEVVFAYFVDPELYRRIPDPPDEFRCALGYLGTYAADRQLTLDQLMIEPARQTNQSNTACADQKERDGFTASHPH